MLLILALFIIRPKVGKEPAPFVATIITPEELKAKAPSHSPPAKEPSRAPRLPKNLPPPEKLTAIPSSHAPAVKSRSTGRIKSAAPSSEERIAARSPEPGSSQHRAVGPAPSQEQGAAQEEQRSLIKGKENGNSSKSGQGGPFGKTIRERLFDRDVIAKLTPKTSEKPENDNGITFDTKEYKYYGYMQRLREKIESIWKYPAEAAERKLNGELYIRFTIKKDGTLGAVELVHTSGYKTLDDAAIRALRDADPYWPLPDSWKEDSLTITGHFVYYFQNTFIR
jgi:protein TonB